MHFTTYGYKVPDQGDKAKGALGWMQSLGDNINRYDGHNHDGVNSPFISMTAILPIFNVKTYGAVGDGSTDDTAAIQAAITAAASAELYFPEGTYKVSSGLTVSHEMRITGASMRTAALYWTGGAGTILHVTDACNAFEIDSICFDNAGTATMGLYVECERVKMSRIFSSPAVKFSTAIISTSTSETCENICLRDSYLAASTTGQQSPIGFYAARGTCYTVDNCFFSGLVRALVCGGAGGQTIGGMSIIGCRFQTFDASAAGYPGSNSDIGIDAVQVDGLSITGCSWEFGGGNGGAVTGQLCIKLTTINSGAIRDSVFYVDGQNNAVINVTSVNCIGVIIDGCYFASFINTFAVAATGGASIWQVEFGLNRVWSAAHGVYDNTFTPTIAFGGASVGVTYSLQRGKAQRVGKFIIARGLITLTSKGSSTGTVRIVGGPVNADSNVTAGYDGNFETPAAVTCLALTGVAGHIDCIIRGGEKNLQFFYLGTGAITEFTDAVITNSSSIYWQVTYEALN